MDVSFAFLDSGIENCLPRLCTLHHILKLSRFPDQRVVLVHHHEHEIGIAEKVRVENLHHPEDSLIDPPSILA